MNKENQTFPQTIHFLSDDTIANYVNEIVGTDKKVKERIANYQYTKAKVNNGQIFSMFLSQIDNLEKSGLIICK